MKNNKKKSSVKWWNGIPDELRYMCLSEIVSSGYHYCSEPALHYLDDHMNDCDFFIYGVTPIDIIRWIDVVFEMCLFPLETHEDVWKTNRDLIQKILNRFETLLKKIAPDNYENGYRRPNDEHRGISIIGLAQRLNIYFSVLFMYAGDWGNYKSRLAKVLSDTKRNVRQMLYYSDAEKYAKQDISEGYHYSGFDTWETLNWIVKEFLPGGEAIRQYAHVYKKYVMFLDDMDRCPADERCFINDKARSFLSINAEKHYSNLCQLILDEVECQMEDSEEDDTFLFTEKAMYENEILRSNERRGEA